MSAGVVVGGAIIYFTQYAAIDPIISIIVSIVMILGVTDILENKFPYEFGLSAKEYRREWNKKRTPQNSGVSDVHHMHVWSLSTTENAMTAHVVIGEPGNENEIKKMIRHKLLHKNVRHVTIETEHERCEDGPCGQW